MYTPYVHSDQGMVDRYWSGPSTTDCPRVSRGGVQVNMAVRDNGILAGSPLARRGKSNRRRLARVATITLLGLMLIAGFGVAAPEGASAGQAGVINTNNVEIFDHPTSLNVIGYVDSGTWVDIFWGPEFHMYEIRTGDGTVGWVWAEFLDPNGGESESEVAAAPADDSSSSSSSADQANAWAWSAWAMVDADSLNVRGDASSSAGVLDSYGPGEWIEVIGNDVNGYSPVNYYGDVGWVASQYLSWDGSYNYATVSSGASSEVSTSNLGGGSASSSQENWIDINGATGEVNLMVGNSVYATY